MNIQEMTEKMKQLKNTAENIRNRHLQRVRVQLQALVDDPKHPFTETDFLRSMIGYAKGSNKALGLLLQVPAAAQKIIAGEIGAVLAGVAESYLGNDCPCPDCRAERGE